VLWENAEYRRFYERLASFSRLILFDKRGMGLSDRVRVGTLEERMDDVRVVMDAVGSESAALLGVPGRRVCLSGSIRVKSSPASWWISPVASMCQQASDDRQLVGAVSGGRAP
jgi:hypothetical protein